MANKITNIKERILYISDYYSIKKEKFFDDLELNYGNFKGKAKETPINSDSLANIVTKFPDVNLDWLLTGNGQMIKGTESYNSTVSEPSEVYRLRTDNNIALQQIPLYSLEVAAGIVQLFRDQVPTKEYISIPNLPKCDGALYVTGDSMYPLLKSGDIVMYKQIKDLSNCVFIWGEMYLICFEVDGDYLTSVKYIQKSDMGKDYVKLVSQNDHHQPIDLPKDTIRALAMVKASIRINAMN